MSSSAIKVQGLGKRYAVGGASAHIESFRDLLRSVATAPLRLVTGGRYRPAGPETFWALKDLEFEVPRGEALGVIGRNGAGKSTLLKILTGITEPTEGRVELRGRVASLLEVGTGFHPELSGRENVYLNGAILGMTRQEIRRKFDEIVDFAGVEKFIDTPVKHFSSGMYMRLAFSVAAHLEQEILLVDEVLAVGDAEFQKKCLGKMDEVATAGRTVLFVSHNMGAVRRLCPRSLLLQQGQALEIGPTDGVIPAYYRSLESAVAIPLTERTDRRGSGEARFTSLRIEGPDGRVRASVVGGEPFDIVLEINNATDTPLESPRVGISIDDDWGRIAVLCTDADHHRLASLPPGVSEVRFRIEQMPVGPGTFRLVLFLAGSRGPVDWLDPGGNLQVDAGEFFPTGWIPSAAEGRLIIAHTTEPSWLPPSSGEG